MIASVVLALSQAAAPAASDSAQAPVTVAEIAGVWAGTLSHAGETEPIALDLESGPDGKVLIRMSVPVAHLARAPIGRVSAEVQGTRYGWGRSSSSSTAGRRLSAAWRPRIWFRSTGSR